VLSSRNRTPRTCTRTMSRLLLQIRAHFASERRLSLSPSLPLSLRVQARIKRRVSILRLFCWARANKRINIHDASSSSSLSQKHLANEHTLALGERRRQTAIFSIIKQVSKYTSRSERERGLVGLCGGRSKTPSSRASLDQLLTK
jgi:hypothetical protein